MRSSPFSFSPSETDPEHTSRSQTCMLVATEHSFRWHGALRKLLGQCLGLGWGNASSCKFTSFCFIGLAAGKCQLVPAFLLLFQCSDLHLAQPFALVQKQGIEKLPRHGRERFNTGTICLLVCSLKTSTFQELWKSFGNLRG